MYRQLGYYYPWQQQMNVNWNYNQWSRYDPSYYTAVYGWNETRSSSDRNQTMNQTIKDYGAKPFAINIEEAAKQNNNFRTALWTGEHLQVTLMSIGVGEDIGLEIHPELDQFLRIEEGRGLVQMGKTKDHLDFRAEVGDDYAVVIPAGTWHNLTNTGSKPIKLYSIYAPPQHPFGTIHKTKAEAMAAEEAHA